VRAVPVDGLDQGSDRPGVLDVDVEPGERKRFEDLVERRYRLGLPDPQRADLRERTFRDRAATPVTRFRSSSWKTMSWSSRVAWTSISTYRYPSDTAWRNAAIVFSLRSGQDGPRPPMRETPPSWANIGKSAARTVMSMA